MSTFEEEMKAEIEALRVFRARLEEQRAAERQRAEDHGFEINNLKLPQVKALISMRFETARLRNRLAQAEKRLTNLEQTGGRAR